MELYLLKMLLLSFVCDIDRSDAGELWLAASLE